MPPSVVIIGGSVGGLRTAERLRRVSYPGSVTVLEASHDLPYDRTALSKTVITRKSSPASIRLRDRAELEKLDITFRTGQRAVGLDTRNRFVHLSDGRSLDYSDVVIATGAEARELPAAPRRPTHYLRTLLDARPLCASMKRARSALVIGAEFIGSEVAAALSTLDTRATVVEAGSAPLSPVLGAVVGARLAALHARHGVTLIAGRSVVAVRPLTEGAQQCEVELDDGTARRADLIVAGVGARPATGWLQESGIGTADGVDCDEYCQASAENVYAVGDVARWPNTLFAETMRVEHWTNAIEQAAVVGWNIARRADRRKYAPVPYVWSDQYGVRLQILGRPRPDDDVHRVDDEPDRDVLVALFERDGLLSGAFAINSDRSLPIRRALAARASITQTLETLR